MTPLKKIVIIGPESTGKSTLSKQLAQHYNTLWVPEYAREYLEQTGVSYLYEDLLVIAREQRQREEMLSGHTKELLFIDTDLQVIKVWSEFVFNKCHSWILNQVAQSNYDLYLLCNVDLPWVADNLREYPDLHTRLILYQYYKDIMINQSVPWVEISGNYEGRLMKAITAVDNISS